MYVYANTCDTCINIYNIYITCKLPMKGKAGEGSGEPPRAMWGGARTKGGRDSRSAGLGGGVSGGRPTKRLLWDSGTAQDLGSSVCRGPVPGQGPLCLLCGGGRGREHATKRAASPPVPSPDPTRRKAESQRREWARSPARLWLASCCFTMATAGGSGAPAAGQLQEPFLNRCTSARPG